MLMTVTSEEFSKAFDNLYSRSKARVSDGHDETLADLIFSTWLLLLLGYFSIWLFLDVLLQESGNFSITLYILKEYTLLRSPNHKGIGL